MRLKGDAAKGRLVYQKLCVSCHKIGSEGHALGPDLVTMKSMGREKILVNILDPNREVAPQYFGYSIDVKDGESYSGLIASENDNTVTLKAAFGAMTPVSRSDISAMKSTGMSIMPEGLEAGLPHQDMADLIEFIVTADAK
jgi:putative heme-binding domain-containing protein